MNDKLPPADFAAWAEGDNGIPKITTGYSPEAVLAYGQQCRHHALEEAARVCDAIKDKWVDGSDQYGQPCLAREVARPAHCAAAIRALKEKT